MKFLNFLFSLLFLVPLVSFGSYVSQDDLVYWDILSFTDDTLVTVDSKISALLANNQISCLASFTALQSIQSSYQSVEGLLEEAVLLTSDADKTVQVIQSFVGDIASQIILTSTLLSNMHQVDFGGTWTLIQGIQETESSLIGQMLPIIQTMDSTVDVLRNNQLIGFIGTSTMLHSLSDILAFNITLLSSLADVSFSTLDVVETDLITIISNIDVASSIADAIDDELVADCAGTATALQELNVIIQNIYVAGASITNTYVSSVSALNALYTSVSSSNVILLSELEVILANVETVNNLLNTTSSLVDTMSVSLSTVNSTLDDIIVLTGTLIVDVESLLDREASLGSMIDGVTYTENVFNALSNSLIDSLNAFLTAESALDVTIPTYNTISSTLNIISNQLYTDIITINTAETNVQLLSGLLTANQSVLDVNLGTYVTIHSSLNVLDQTIGSLVSQTATVLSAVEIVESDIGGAYSTENTIQSGVSVLSSLSNTIESITNVLVSSENMLFSEIDSVHLLLQTALSKASVVDSKIDFVGSKIGVITDNVTTINSNLVTLGVEFQQTWTMIEAINRIPSTISTLAVTIESQLAVLATATFSVDFSGTYTALNELDNSFLSVESVISTIVLNAPDTAGSYTAIAGMNDQVTDIYQTLDSMLDAMVNFATLGAIGSPITNALVGLNGYTITQPGKYYLAETINFAPTIANKVAITVNASNVYIDLAGKTLINAASVTTGVGGISIAANASNVAVANGTISAMNGNNLIVGNNASLITFSNLRVIDASSIGLAFSGSVTNLVMQRVTVSGCTSYGLSLLSGSDIYIEDCVFSANQDDGIHINPGAGTIQRVFIRRSSFFNNSTVGGGHAINIDGTSGTRSKFVIDRCEMLSNSGAGIRASQVIRSVFKNNVIMFNSTNGITLVNAVDTVQIFDNLLIDNTGFGLQVVSSTASPCAFMRNVFLLNTANNYSEGASAGPHTLFSNYALQSTDAGNYFITGGGTPTFVNEVIRHQGDSFIDNAEKWINISMLTT